MEETDHEATDEVEETDHEATDRGLPEIEPPRSASRRRFLGLLGSGPAMIQGISGTADAQTTPIVSMENNYFDPIGLYVEPGTRVRFEIESGSHSATAYADRLPPDAPPSTAA